MATKRIRKSTVTKTTKHGASNASAKNKAPRKWSRKVTETSDSLSLEDKVFQQDDPSKIAASLKRSADRSRKRKTTAFQSAMSMLNFYINRAGKNLSEKDKKPLEQAKDELRKRYGREKST